MIRMSTLLRFPFVICCCFSVLETGAGSEIKPADSKTPLFRIFAPTPMKPAGRDIPAGFTFDDKHPLLVVRSVSDVRLARDGKGVLIILTPADAQKFAEITRKYNQGLLFLEAENRVLAAMQITAPITDGALGFNYPDQAAVTEYLRRRFRLAGSK
jgi:hypothetical protein